MTRIAFLGPRATFTEQALRSMPEAAGAELVPAAGSPAVLAAVRDGSADLGCVPIENSVEGAVPAVLDGLVADPPLVIVREALLPVRFALLVRPGTRIADVRTIASHPHGIAQTRGWIAAQLPDAKVLLSDSTSEAAAQVARGEFDAAVSAPLAALQHGLEILADDIADNAGAVTRFALVSPPGPPPPPSGHDRTSLAATTQNRPGALLGLLTELAVRYKSKRRKARLRTIPTLAGPHAPSLATQLWSRHSISLGPLRSRGTWSHLRQVGARNPCHSS